MSLFDVLFLFFFFFAVKSVYQKLKLKSFIYQKFSILSVNDKKGNGINEKLNNSI